MVSIRPLTRANDVSSSPTRWALSCHMFFMVSPLSAYGRTDNPCPQWGSGWGRLLASDTPLPLRA